ncbi:hypothetical protein EKN83_06455 [Enterobacter sp. WCHEn090032]|nr:hypothetical protein EKN83_06455 [Enterobacter sp. WCHEn090032]
MRRFVGCWRSGTRLRKRRVAAAPYPAYRTSPCRPDKRSAIRLRFYAPTSSMRLPSGSAITAS